MDAASVMRNNGAARVAMPADEAVLNDDAPAPEVREQTSHEVVTDARLAEDLLAPVEASFVGRDYLPAPGLRRAALGLIMRDSALRHLQDQHLEFLWKRRGGTRRGVANIGDCVMPAGLGKHAWNAMAQARSGSNTEHVLFVIWLSADHLEQFTPMQVEASLYRQLLKTTTDPRDHSAFKLRAPDFGGFIREIERYGLWNQSLVQAAPAFSQAQNVDQNTQQALFDQATSEGSDPWASEGNAT